MCGVCPPSAECSESTEIQEQAKVTICPSETLIAQGFSEGILRLEGSLSLIHICFALVAHSDACPNVAIADETRGFYGVQFHPEVNHSENGVAMIRNFLYEVCGAKGDWTMEDYCRTAIAQIRELSLIHI